MRKLLLLFLASGLLLTACQEKNMDDLVVIHTRFGDMTVLLYEETPIHKENFLQLARSGKYDSVSFHRVIKDFMIQTGDISQRVTDENERREVAQKTIEAEMNRGFYHEKGAVAAARQGDNVNPERRSSAHQFYIVDGQAINDMEKQQQEAQRQSMLAQLLAQPQYDTLRTQVMEWQRTGNRAALDSLVQNSDSLLRDVYGDYDLYELPDSIMDRYDGKEGAPHLDGTYTVFGRVVEGLNVIDSIAAVRTGAADKPVEPVYMTVEVQQMKKKEVTEKYGYQYPEEE